MSQEILGIPDAGAGHGRCRAAPCARTPHDRRPAFGQLPVRPLPPAVPRTAAPARRDPRAPRVARVRPPCDARRERREPRHQGRAARADMVGTRRRGEQSSRPHLDVAPSRGQASDRDGAPPRVPLHGCGRGVRGAGGDGGGRAAQPAAAARELRGPRGRSRATAGASRRSPARHPVRHRRERQDAARNQACRARGALLPGRRLVRRPGAGGRIRTRRTRRRHEPRHSRRARHAHHRDAGPPTAARAGCCWCSTTASTSSLPPRRWSSAC